MTVSEYIFEFLQTWGCQTVYMVSGSSAMWLTDALQRNGRLKAICCHHEQAAAMAGISDGAIVGSAIVKLIEKYGKEAPAHVGEYVKRMKDAVKAVS